MTTRGSLLRDDATDDEDDSRDEGIRSHSHNHSQASTAAVSDGWDTGGDWEDVDMLPPPRVHESGAEKGAGDGHREEEAPLARMLAFESEPGPGGGAGVRGGPEAKATRVHPWDEEEGDVGADVAAAAPAAAYGPPWYTWLILVAAVIAVSSAGAVLSAMNEVKPLNLANWRLFSTSLVLLPGFLVQWAHADSEMRGNWIASLPNMLVSGAFLAVHFALWVWSLHHTSLAHSLLFVSATPLLVALLAIIRREPISKGELFGIALGVAGGAMLALSAKGESDVSLPGDAAALAAAAGFVGYITVGRHLRSWMPLFLYAAPVTLVSALALMLASVIIEGSRVSPLDKTSIFGWLSLKYLGHTVYLALGPGLVGHTGFNALLGWMPTVVVAMSICFEPLLGTLIGWLLGVSPPPGLLTCIGGAVLIAAVAIVNAANWQREKQQADGGGWEKLKTKDEEEERAAFLRGEGEEEAGDSDEDIEAQGRLNSKLKDQVEQETSLDEGAPPPAYSSLAVGGVVTVAVDAGAMNAVPKTGASLPKKSQAPNTAAPATKATPSKGERPRPEDCFALE